MSGDGRAAARRLGRLGVWANLDAYTGEQLRAFARECEGLGYTALWYPETVGGKEAFSLAALLLESTTKLAVATGIANLWARDPMAMANGARSLGEWSGGRFVLGIGVSHAPSVATRGSTYARPYERTVEYLDALDAARYTGPGGPPFRLLAALGPRMLRLAAERADGAHPYFVPLEHTTKAREVLGREPALAVEQAVVLETDAATARSIARLHTRRYLALENYANNLRRLGWSDADLRPDGGSDALVDAIVAWGTAREVSRRLEEHLARGADHVCVQVFRAEAKEPPSAGIRDIAKPLA